MATAPRVTARLTGVWDTRIAPPSLGGVLILAEELLMQSSEAEVCFVGGPELRRSPMATAAASLCGISGCWVADSVPALETFGGAVWPRRPEAHPYGSTLVMQRLYRRGLAPRPLRVKLEATARARKFLARRAWPNVPVALHLKNNPAEQGCSNANFAAWREFLGAAGRRCAVMFVLIGSEPVDGAIRELPNVVVAADEGVDLGRDLALIEQSRFFMGMASGPCNFAIFNRKPYTIFKNPDHHAEAMQAELGSGHAFPFATTGQRLLRVFETPEILTREFELLWSLSETQDER
jgi:hypothetical protein